MQLEMLLLRHTPVRLASSLAAGLMALSACAPPVWSATKPDPGALLHSLPLRIEQDAKGHWSARGAGYAVGFEPAAVDLRVPDGLVRLSFEGANKPGKGSDWEASQKMLAPTNYFRGDTFRSADAFSRLRRPNLYPGIDVVYYGASGHLEYDFNLAPGADPSRIRLRFEGADQVSVNDAGAVVLKLGSGEMVQQLPVVYQKRASGEIVAVNASYRLNADGSVGVVLSHYDRTQALVIDPSILYDFWFTGSNAQVAISMGHDAHGFEYLAGYTFSPDFTAGGNGYDPNYSSDEDCWLVKINPFATTGQSVVVYSTYFGGQFDDDMRSMVVDANGIMYFGGTSLSPDLPVTANAFQNMLPNINAALNGFVAEIDTNQAGAAALIYSSFYGGSMDVVINGVATFEGQIYATGYTVTPDLPAAGSLFQAALAGSYDSFVAVFNPALTCASSTLVFSSYLGGYSEDVGRSIDVDSTGKAYVTGFTFSSNFPVTATAFQPIYNDGGGDAFLTVVDPVAGAVTYSTFLGGTGIDVATKVQVETTGHVAITGFTFSTDFPLSPTAAQPLYGGDGDAFIAVLDPSAASPATGLVYGTYYGGSGSDVAYDVRRDGRGFYYIAGYSFSTNLPVSANALNPITDPACGGVLCGTNAFSAIIDPNTALVYGSYITGPGNAVAYAVDYDASGNIYATGYATSNIFPNNTPPHSVPGNYDVFFLLVSPK